MRVHVGDDRNRFLTYLYYVVNLQLLLESRYGHGSNERYQRVYQEAWKASVGIHRRHIEASLRARFERQYRAALSNLTCLHLEVASEEFFEAKNAWTPAQAWYAVHHALGALGVFVSPHRSPDHAQSCRDAAQLVADRNVVPYPWSLYVRTSFKTKTTTDKFGFIDHPTPLSTLAPPALRTFEDRCAVMLDTTAKRRVERTFAEERLKKVAKGRTKRALSRDIKNAICEKQGATTLFDVLYRLRIRANYGDVDTFVVGCDSPDEARRFASALHVVADSTLAVIEAVIDRYVQKGKREEILASFASRNRAPGLLEHRHPPA